jgi:hypothetical protein
MHAHRFFYLAVLTAAFAALYVSLAMGQSRQAQPRRDTPAVEQPRGTASLTGRVVAADTGRPVRRATVQVAGDSLPRGQSAVTDENGWYVLRNLPAGVYTVSASKNGFVRLFHGQQRPSQPRRRVPLRDGEQLKAIDVYLARGSVITGHVYDEAGEPLVGALVRVARQDHRSDGALVSAGQDRTDDRGQYRVFGLQPGRYYVSVVPTSGLAGLTDFRGAESIREVVDSALETVASNQGRAMAGPGGGLGPGMGGPMRLAAELAGLEGSADNSWTPAPTYYPGVSNLNEAAPVTVGLSQEAASVDFSVQMVPMARVSGSVVGSDDSQSRGAIVMLTPEDGPSLAGGVAAARVQPDGTFTMPNVPPGRYLIGARGMPGFGGGRQGAAQAAVAIQPLTVMGRDVSNVNLVLGPGASMNGLVRFETSSGETPPDPRTITITAAPLERTLFAGSVAARPQTDGSFALAGIAPGRRLIQASGLRRPWTLKAVYADQREITDLPVELRGGQVVQELLVVITDASTELTAIVQDGLGGAPATDCTVIVFPGDPALWISQGRAIRADQPDGTGRVTFTGLPPGMYLMAAVAEVEDGEWFDREFLQRLRPRAVPVSLAEGESRTQTLQMVRGS